MDKMQGFSGGDFRPEDSFPPGARSIYLGRLAYLTEVMEACERAVRFIPDARLEGYTPYLKAKMGAHELQITAERLAYFWEGLKELGPVIAGLETRAGTQQASSAGESGTVERAGSADFLKRGSRLEELRREQADYAAKCAVETARLKSVMKRTAPSLGCDGQKKQAAAQPFAPAQLPLAMHLDSAAFQADEAAAKIRRGRDRRWLQMNPSLAAQGWAYGARRPVDGVSQIVRRKAYDTGTAFRVAAARLLTRAAWLSDWAGKRFGSFARSLTSRVERIVEESGRPAPPRQRQPSPPSSTTPPLAAALV